MLRSGRYKAKCEGDIFHAYRYIMEVKETEKSNIFKPVEAENRYAYDHLELILKAKNGLFFPRIGLATMLSECGAITISQSIHFRLASRSGLGWMKRYTANMIEMSG